jgi:lysophospholipase L1-like esterase
MRNWQNPSICTALLLSVLTAQAGCLAAWATNGDWGILPVVDNYRVLLSDRKLILAPLDQAAGTKRQKSGTFPTIEIQECPLVEINEPLDTSQIRNSLSAWQQSVRRSTFVTQRHHFLADILIGGSVQTSSQPLEASGGTQENTCEKENKDTLADIQIAGPEQLKALDKTFLSLLGLSYENLQKEHITSVRYRVRTRRIDTLVKDRDGNLAVATGEPDYLCPCPPVLVPGCRVLANIYAPVAGSILSPSDIMPVVKAKQFEKHEIHSDEHPLANSLLKLKTNEGLKIIFWGDSVTAGGFATSPQHFFTTRFLRLLQGAFPDNRISYLNMGVSGATSSRLLPSFASDVLAKMPDLIIVEFVNDYTQPVCVLNQVYESIIRQARTAGSDLLICVPHLVVPDFLAMHNWHDVANSPFPSLVRRICTQHNIACADVAHKWDCLQEEGLRPELLLTDKLLHPNDLGHKIYAEEIFACFQKN